MSNRIITCPEWGARKPKSPPVIIRQAPGIIFHHTDSHLRQISNPKDESLAEAMRYARDIQNFHMGPERDWNDSGHNFLVTRGGHILQGRWMTVTAIQAGHMVVSAHCPSYNHWIGIEHEHLPGEKPTVVQLDASAWLQAWIAREYDEPHTLRVDPHKAHYATSCPDTLTPYIGKVRAHAEQLLNL